MTNKSRNKADNCVKQDCDAQLPSSVKPADEDSSAANKSTLCRDKSIISGYLYKRGRQRKWKRRWFEIDGKCLLYFKSDKRKTPLASLDLLHVGSVRMDDTDPAGCSFIIEVAGRNYCLCADSKDHAMDWVISMNRVREARMEIGNLKLIEPLQNEIKILALQNEIKILEDDCTPRVVIVAPRKRAKGLGMEDFNEEEEAEDNKNDRNVTGHTEALSPVSEAESIVSSNTSSRYMGNKRQGVLARWKKRRSSYQNWMRRLSRWAQRLRSVRCVIKDDFEHLDNSEGRHLQEKSPKKTLVETHDSEPQVKYEGVVTRRIPSLNSALEGGVDPTKKYAQHTDLDPEVHVAGQTLNHISEGDAGVSLTSKLQANDEVYTALQKNKGIGSQELAIRKKVEDSSSRDISPDEDVDKSSEHSSTNNPKPVPYVLPFAPVNLPERTLNQISEADTAHSEIPESQVNDKIYTAHEQKPKVTTASWGMASQKRALREKMEDLSSRESSANGDVDSSSGRESPVPIDDEGSGVV